VSEMRISLAVKGLILGVPTRARYAVLREEVGLCRRFRRRNPRVLLAFLLTELICSDHLRRSSFRRSLLGCLTKSLLN